MADFMVESDSDVLPRTRTLLYNMYIFEPKKYVTTALSEVGTVSLCSVVYLRNVKKINSL